VGIGGTLKVRVAGQSFTVKTKIEDGVLHAWVLGKHGYYSIASLRAEIREEIIAKVEAELAQQGLTYALKRDPLGPNFKDLVSKADEILAELDALYPDSQPSSSLCIALSEEEEDERLYDLLEAVRGERSELTVVSEDVVVRRKVG